MQSITHTLIPQSTTTHLLVAFPETISVSTSSTLEFSTCTEYSTARLAISRRRFPRKRRANEKEKMVIRLTSICRSSDKKDFKGPAKTAATRAMHESHGEVQSVRRSKIYIMLPMVLGTCGCGSLRSFHFDQEDRQIKKS